MKKFNTLILLISFTINQMVIPVKADVAKLIDPGTFYIPGKIGEIMTLVKGNSGKTIINITDAHCNYSAQDNICKILQYLTSNETPEIVFLEGGSGKYDFSVFDKINDTEIKERIVEILLKEGRLSGAEKYGIGSNNSIRLEGLEEKDLYDKNLGYYRGSLTMKDTVQPYLDKLRGILAKIKKNLYSEEMIKIDDMFDRYESGELNIKDLIVLISGLLAQKSADLLAYKNIVGLAGIVNDEKRIDFERAEKEMENVMDLLTKTLPGNERTKLLEQLTGFKDGDIDKEMFYGYLFKQLRLSSADMSNYENLRKYSEYISGYENIDKGELAREIRRARTDLFEKSFTGDDQKELFALVNYLVAVDKLINAKLVKEEFNDYIKMASRVDLDGVKAFIAKNYPIDGDHLNMSEAQNEYPMIVDLMEKFYKCSFERDVVFLGKIDKYMTVNKMKSAVMVTGGFHKDNLKGLFEKAGFNYIEVMPVIKKTDVANNYFKLLSGERSDLEGFIDTAVSLLPGNSFLALRSVFSEMGISDIKAGNETVLKIAMLEKLLNGEEFTIRTKQGWWIVISPEGVKSVNANVFKSDTGTIGGQKITAEVFRPEARFDANVSEADIVLVDGDELNHIQQELWIDGLGKEMGYKALRDVIDTEPFIDKLYEFGLEEQHVEYLKLNYINTDKLRVWNDKDMRMPVDGHPGAEGVVYLTSHLFNANDTRGAVLAFLHELGGAYKNGELKRTHADNRQLDDAYASGDRDLIKKKAIEIVEFASGGTGMARGEKRDYADKVDMEAAKPVTIEDFETLTSDHQKENVIRELKTIHAEIMSMAEEYKERTGDPKYLTITMREQKRFLKTFESVYYKRIKETGDESLSYAHALNTAKQGYYDIFPESFVREEIGDVNVHDAPLPEELDALHSEVYRKLSRAIDTDFPSLFNCPVDTLGELDDALDIYVRNHSGIGKVEKVVCTPDTDSTQLIGCLLPVDPKDRKGAEKVRFEMGVIYRMVEHARDDPEHTHILRLDQLEALSPKVWVILNQFLLTDEMTVPEADPTKGKAVRKLKRPKNLKIITSINKGLDDSAFYDRFLRKTIDSPSDEVLGAYIMSHYGLPEWAAKDMVSLKNNNEAVNNGQLFIILDYIKGRLSESESKGEKALKDIIDQEVGLYLGNLKPLKPGDGYETKVEFKDDKLMFDGVELAINDGLRAKIKQAVKSQDDIEAIKKAIKETVSISMTRDVARALSAIARNYRYGNKVIQLEGPTGSGKTFLAESLAKMLNIPFYGEPFHASSKQTKLLGSFVPDPTGEFYLDTDTQFLRHIQDGGVIALSELNACEKDGYARFGWLMVPFASGEDTLELNQYPLPGEGGEMFRSVKRHKDSMIIIDTNPSDAYKSRAALPPMLNAYTPKVWVEGKYTMEELKEISADFIESKEVSGDEKGFFTDVLSELHFKVQEELERTDPKLSRGREHIVTMRELTRTSKMIRSENKNKDKGQNYYDAAMLYYGSAFKNEADRELVKGYIKEILSGQGIAVSCLKERDDNYFLRTSILNTKNSTMLSLPAMDNPFDVIQEALGEEKNVEVEKYNANYFTDDFGLLGGYVPNEGSKYNEEMAFRMVDGIILKNIKKALKEKDKTFILAFENFHYLRPKMAVALNSILQDRVYYSIAKEGGVKTKERIEIPDNLKFVSTASNEVEFQMSLAEQSRWVRIFGSGDKSRAPPEERQAKVYADADELRKAYKKDRSQLDPNIHPEPVTDGKGLLVPTKEMMEAESRMVDAMDDDKVILLEGPPGGGKTEYALDIANRLGLKSYLYSAHANSHLRDLIGSYVQDKDGKYVLTAREKDGHFMAPFLECLKNGGVFIIDEGAIGVNAQAIISWLTGIARGDKEIAINEHLGMDEPLRIKRHENFHLVITTNPVEETPDRMKIPIEVLERSERIWVTDDICRKSYDSITEFFYDLYAGNDPKMAEHKKNYTVAALSSLHIKMKEILSAQGFVNDPDRHLMTLRDLKALIAAFSYYVKAGMDSKPAFNAAFELVYLAQFSDLVKIQILKKLEEVLDGNAKDRIDFNAGRFEDKPMDMAGMIKRGPMAQSEQKVIKQIKDLIGINKNPLLLLEPGSREKEIISAFSEKEGYELFHCDSHPEMTSLDLIGGTFPFFEEKGMEAERLSELPGFIGRHLVRKEDIDKPGEKKLLVIHNIDALHEKVRTVLNNFLLKGSIDIQDQMGRTRTMYLPKNVRIMAACSEKTGEEISGAFWNRFQKIDVPPISYMENGNSELLELLLYDSGLSEYGAMGEMVSRYIQYLHSFTDRLDAESEWPSGKKYAFTVKEALLLGKYVKIAIDDAKKDPEEIDVAKAKEMVIREAYNLYGGKIKEHQSDLDFFEQNVLKIIFDHRLVKNLSGTVVKEKGVVTELAGVKLPHGTKGKRLEDIDPEYRLILVKEIVNTMAGIVRAWRSGKVVSMTGETGTAKTTMGVFLSQLMFGEEAGEDSYYIFSTHGASKARDLEYQLRMTEEGKYRLEIQEFIKKIEEGNKVIIIDEANMRPEMLWAINAIARGEKEITLQIPGEKQYKVRVGDNVNIIMTMNPTSYKDRKDVPGILKENVVNLWSSLNYSEAEMDMILKGMMGAMERKLLGKKGKVSQEAETSEEDKAIPAKDGVFEDFRGSIDLEKFLERVYEFGHDEALEKTPQEVISNLEKELLERDDVKKRMARIETTVKNLTRGISVEYSTYYPWGQSNEAGKLLIPLDQLVNPLLTDDMIISFIMHEIRHWRYSPTPKDIMGDIAEDLVKTIPKAREILSSSDFNYYWNVLEDHRINAVRTRFDGENSYIDTFIGTNFTDPEQSLKIQEKLETFIDGGEYIRAFWEYILYYGYAREHTPGFPRYPKALRDAINKITDGGDNSVLYRAVLSGDVHPDYDALVIDKNAPENRAKMIKAAINSLKVIIGEIHPVFLEVVEYERKEREKKHKDKDKGEKTKKEAKAPKEAKEAKQRPIEDLSEGPLTQAPLSPPPGAMPNNDKGVETPVDMPKPWDERPQTDIPLTGTSGSGASDEKGRGEQGESAPGDDMSGEEYPSGMDKGAGPVMPGSDAFSGKTINYDPVQWKEMTKEELERLIEKSKRIRGATELPEESSNDFLAEIRRIVENPPETPHEFEGYRKFYREFVEQVKYSHNMAITDELFEYYGHLIKNAKTLRDVIDRLPEEIKKLMDETRELFEEIEEDIEQENSETGMQIDIEAKWSRKKEQFIENIIKDRKRSDIAVGVTLVPDMWASGAYEEILAVFLQTFNKLERRKVEYSVSFSDVSYSLREGIAFNEKVKKMEQLEQRYREMLLYLALTNHGNNQQSSKVGIGRFTPLKLVLSIMQKYSGVKKTNKIEFIVTDGSIEETSCYMFFPSETGKGYLGSDDIFLRPSGVIGPYYDMPGCTKDLVMEATEALNYLANYEHNLRIWKACIQRAKDGGMTDAELKRKGLTEDEFPGLHVLKNDPDPRSMGARLAKEYGFRFDQWGYNWPSVTEKVSMSDRIKAIIRASDLVTRLRMKAGIILPASEEYLERARQAPGGDKAKFGMPVPTRKLADALSDAKSKGIDIIGVGTKKEYKGVQLFDSWIYIDGYSPHVVTFLMLELSNYKKKHPGDFPKGDLFENLPGLREKADKMQKETASAAKMPGMKAPSENSIEMNLLDLENNSAPVQHEEILIKRKIELGGDGRELKVAFRVLDENVADKVKSVAMSPSKAFFDIGGDTFFAVRREMPDGSINIFLTKKSMARLIVDEKALMALAMHEVYDTGEKEGPGSHKWAWDKVKKENPEGMSSLLRFMIDNMDEAQVKALASEYEEDLSGRKASGEWGPFEEDIHSYCLGRLDAIRTSTETDKNSILKYELSGTSEGRLEKIRCESGIAPETNSTEKARSEMLDVYGKLLSGVYKNTHNKEKCYDFILSAVPTAKDDEGQPVDYAESVLSGLMGKLRSQGDAAVAKAQIGNITSRYTMGALAAKSMVESIVELSKSVPDGRIHCSISAKILKELEELNAGEQFIVGTVKDFLTGHVMLDIITDTATTEKEETVYPLSFAKCKALGLARFNMAHVGAMVDKNDDLYKSSLRLVGLAIAYLTNNTDNADNIVKSLEEASGKDKEFYKRVFELVLPEVAKININEINNIFQAEAEVFASL
ncbi:MAG: AAA family ATPase [Candidatus Omnitrophica bacterium]|nr:AAA family ATPase [Candidatus Omnitrophota bacterium]